MLAQLLYNCELQKDILYKADNVMSSRYLTTPDYLAIFSMLAQFFSTIAGSTKNSMSYKADNVMSSRYLTTSDYLAIFNMLVQLRSTIAGSTKKGMS